MRRRSSRPGRPGNVAGLVLLLLTSFLLAGCFNEPEELSIPPRTEPQNPGEAGLGPGVRPLSYGPGEKSSPSWSPSGDRIAFAVDGYVVTKAPGDRNFERQTTKDFGAQTVAWMSSGDSLAILGEPDLPAEPGASPSPDSRAFYKTAPAEGSLKVNRVSSGVREMAPGPENEWVLLAMEQEESRSGLSFVEPEGEVQTYSAGVEGEITGMSISPSGDQAILAVRDAVSDRAEIYIFSFAESNFQQVTQLEEGMEIIGDPQWTTEGIYYVAGEEQQESTTQDAAPFDLYRIPPGSSTSELAPGIGDDFVASNLKRDPEGRRLALVGRRNPASSENLYILDPGSESLEAATSNEDMQIRTGTEDLAWSPDGGSVVIVARATLSEPKVYSAPASSLVTDFYNLHEVFVDEVGNEPEGGSEG